MKLKRRLGDALYEGDFTPMIDVTFQLISFFMFTINFSQAEQNDRIKLPKSELAQPAQAGAESMITIHITNAGNAILGGQETSPEGLRPYLENEKAVLESKGKTLNDAVVVVRGDALTQTGKVQQVIAECQKAKFEKFKLRAEEDR